MVTMVEVVRRGQGLKWLGGGCAWGWEVKEKAWLAMAAAVVQVEVWKRVLGSHGGFRRGVGGWFCGCLVVSRGTDDGEKGLGCCDGKNHKAEMDFIFF